MRELLLAGSLGEQNTIRELEGLREGSDDGDLISENLRRWPRHASGIAIHTIYNQLPSPPNIVNCILENLCTPRCLHDNIKPLNHQSDLQDGRTYGLSVLICSHCFWGCFLSRKMYSSAASSFCASSILIPALAARVTWHPPLSLRSCAKTRPVGPAPIMRTDEPSLGAIFSRPWAAQEAGSNNVASISFRFSK